LITLPTSTVSLAQAPTCEFEYTVQAGDWLSKIAAKYYGDVLAYPTIVEANNAQADDDYPDIADPDLIEPGWLLCIPSAGNASTRSLSTAVSKTGRDWSAPSGAGSNP
jgi:LysM repeat protein